jgi:hypothetical protein
VEQVQGHKKRKSKGWRNLWVFLIKELWQRDIVASKLEEYEEAYGVSEFRN